MERHLDRSAIERPLEDLFASLSDSIDATNSGIVLPTCDQFNENVPRVRVVDKPMFPKSK
jgi:hypothetical protein